MCTTEAEDVQVVDTMPTDDLSPSWGYKQDIPEGLAVATSGNYQLPSERSE